MMCLLSTQSVHSPVHIDVHITFTAVNSWILHDYLEEEGKPLHLKICLLVQVSVPVHLEKTQI